MALNRTDVDDVRILRVDHPSGAPSLRGREFVTPWFSVDRDRSEDFRRGTYMDQYAHPYPGRSGYGDDLVEGYHLLGVLDVLCNHAIYSDGPWIAWNYGLDRVRFVSAIRFDDEFRIRGEIANVVDRGDQGHLIVADLIGEVRGRDKPGFVVTTHALWTTTPDSSTEH